MNEFYNCVFPACYGGWNYMVNSACVKVQNSLFIGNPTHIDTVPISGSAVNCASTTQYMEPYKGTKTNCLNNVSIDSNYHITSVGWENAGTGTNPDGTIANIGVYGGQFAWGSKVIVDPTSSKLKVVLGVGESLQLSVNNNLDVNQKLTWTSDDTSLVTVDANGIATGVKSGSAVVTVTNADGTYKETINILVINDETDLQLAIDLRVGDTRRLTVDDLTDTVSATWASNSNAVATVSTNGKVTAVGVGTTYVTATDDQGNEIGKILVRVRK
jgi:uncharacterized protein YjdB